MRLCFFCDFNGVPLLGAVIILYRIALVCHEGKSEKETGDEII